VLALLRTRRWLSFTILVIALIVAFGALSRWQWSRAQDKQIERATLETTANARPVNITDALRDAPAAALEWHRVSATGTWQTTGQVLVRRRPLNSTNGFWVMTPLLTASGESVWVNRGWLAARESAGSIIAPPDPSPGEVTIVGYLREYEAGSRQSDLPSGQVSAPTLDELPEVPRPLAGYVQLADPPQRGLVPVPPPDVDDSRNLSYAGQWLLFALVAIGGWFFFLRREAREDAAQHTRQEDS
jgi:cytochrome oxidase assembly protein ShyY1